ncbi:hypothetical protein HAHE_40820 [Haloferula helveola]|uniref:Uncharacterized protein n=1 Tax=Haloferula helveola TaxID=490095 RepID=A0ABN6HFH6_9BACT|nr:hypothetical protein HAHE_40820 [Haloferula helveola]
MPPTSPTPNPARQVERIREILVGRQMEAVERRLDQLEARLEPMPVGGSDAWTEELEALRRESRESAVRLRDDFDAERLRQQEEARMLAQRIEAVVRGRRQMADEARQTLETELRPWFSRWQGELYETLQKRENHLIQQLREELDRMRHWMRGELSAQSDAARLHAAFEQLAASAQAIADTLPPKPNP